VKTHIHHFNISVSDAKISLPFYKSLLTHLGYRIMIKNANHIGATNGTTDLWIVQANLKDQNIVFPHEGMGINHIAFRVSTKKEVADFNEKFLKRHKIKTLYDSPRIFPEYHSGYFAVYFLDPDKIALEVVFIPKFKDRTKVIERHLLKSPV